MRSSITKDGLTLRVVAGTHCAILGMDLQESKRNGCLGFSIQRTDLGPATGPGGAAQSVHWLPNLLQFPNAAAFPGGKFATTETAPLQKFRWGDYGLVPGHRYRFRVIPRYGPPDALRWNPEGHALSEREGVTVEVVTEDPALPETTVVFNRAAAASEAFNRKFSQVPDLTADTPDAVAARQWLSHGLEEALVAYVGRATGSDYALHAAVYEFQKPNLLAALKEAAQQGAQVQVVYHARQKGTGEAAADKTRQRNEDAIAAAGLRTTPNLTVVPRQANPQGAIMHNKFVVLLRKDPAGEYRPVAVWTGSINWSDGAVYGQLNVGHALEDAAVAAVYERYFQLLATDPTTHDLAHALENLTPVSLQLPAGQHTIPIFSPQGSETMLHLYADLCRNATCLFVSAPFALSPIIRAALHHKRPGAAQFLLLDKKSAVGKEEEVHVIEDDPATEMAVATTLPSPLHDFQGALLAEREGFHHAGVHIHSKFILADPFGSDPVLVTGSANFSNNSTRVNDSNSLVIRGNTGVVDIYATDFMRMFEHYHFRASQAKALVTAPLALKTDDTWADEYYVSGSKEARDRRLFAGTL